MDDRGPSVPTAGALPALPLRHAEELERLGQVQETYRPDPSSSRLLWTGFLTFFLLLGLLVLAIPFLPKPKDVPPASLPVVLLVDSVICLILVGCVWRLRQLSAEKRVRIVVLTEGVARFDGKSLLTCRWDEIESVQGIIHKGPQPFASHVLITIRGEKQIRTYWAKEHLAVGEALFRRISEETCRPLLPSCLAAVEAGQTVTFRALDAARWGGLAAWSGIELGISKSGLHWGKRIVAWDDANNIDFKDGLRIRSQHQTRFGLFHPWIRLADIPIPNSLVFMRLAEHYLRRNGQHVG